LPQKFTNSQHSRDHHEGARDGHTDRNGSHRRYEAQFDPSDAAGVAEAEARFKELTGAGFTAAERTGRGQSKVVGKFDPAAEETLFIPRLKGG